MMSAFFRDDVRLLVDVIAECDPIDARRAELPIQRRRDSGPVVGVLRIGDDAIEVFPGDEQWHGSAHELDAGGTNDIADEEETHKDANRFR